VRFRLFTVGLLALLLVLTASAQNEALPLRNPQRQAIFDRLEAITSIPLREWRFHAGDVANANAPDLDDSSWPAANPGYEWNTGAAWFRTVLQVPSSLAGYDLRGARLRLDFIVEGEDPPQYNLFVNGLSVAVAEDIQSLTVAERIEPGQKIFLAVRVQSLPVRQRLMSAKLNIDTAPSRPDPRIVRDEFRSSEQMLYAPPAGGVQRENEWSAALSAIDIAALDHGDQKAFDRSLELAHQKLVPLGEWLKQFSIRAAGNSHIDMAWLWPWTETVMVTRNTFASALQLMREFPDFTFTMASAQTYAWMEEKYPDIFREIQQRVKEGRWEVIGGMWVEPDLNLPDGESLTRQVLFGKRYFQSRFGVDIRTGWNPDSFGYNWQLPQIYKKSGIDYFVTQKIYWNDTTKFPYKLFWWEAPDGSRLLTYFPHDYANAIYPAQMTGDLANYAPSMGYPEMLYLFGVGDHGGGPTRNMLSIAEIWKNPQRIYPRLFMGTAQPYFDQLTRDLPKLKVPTWRDELYLEYHRGTYTTQSEAKKRNRGSEELMLNAEKFASLDALYGVAYPQAELNSAWRKVLFNQFHDILPGSSIAPVYLDQARDLADVKLAAGAVLDNSLADLVSRIDAQGHMPVAVFNPLSWTRTDVVEVEVEDPGVARYYEARDKSGKPMVTDVVERVRGTDRVRLRFLAEDVPPLGYKVFNIFDTRSPGKARQTLVATPTSLENEFVRLRLDPKTGCITSLVDKTSNYESIAKGGCGNLLQTFVDKPKDWDAWNIDANFEDQKWDLMQPESVQLVEHGPTRAVIRVVKKFQQSTFTQDITLYPRIARVDVNMSADWHEKHILLKVAFPVNAKNDYATFEIPYGSIQRPTIRNTPSEKAKFEVPALRWADLSDAAGGFSLLNASKYGYDAKGNVVRLSLLRAPEWPDPNADQGFHEFTYALYPHAGDWRRATTIRRGYELNYKLIPVFVCVPHRGLPPLYSFARVDAENVVLTAIKKAEDDDALIFRFYEWAGREGPVRLTLPAGATQAFETNLLEQSDRELPIEAGAVTVATKPYEIKTVKVKFGK
jgi:alpha-mannosidase